MSARLAPTDGGVRIRLFRSVPCEIVREDVQPHVEVQERTVSTAGWVWTGALLAIGAVALAAPRKDSGKDNSVEAGSAYLAAGGTVLIVAMGRSGTSIGPAPPRTTWATERRMTCPTTRASGVAVNVEVDGLVFDGVTDLQGVVDVPLPMGERPWRIKANSRIVSDVKSE